MIALPTISEAGRRLLSPGLFCGRVAPREGGNPNLVHICRGLPTIDAPGNARARTLCSRYLYFPRFQRGSDNLDDCSCLACARALNERTLSGEIKAGREP